MPFMISLCASCVSLLAWKFKTLELELFVDKKSLMWKYMIIDLGPSLKLLS